jgi:hypothetical protein
MNVLLINKVFVAGWIFVMVVIIEVEVSMDSESSEFSERFGGSVG